MNHIKKIIAFSLLSHITFFCHGQPLSQALSLLKAKLLCLAKQVQKPKAPLAVVITPQDDANYMAASKDFINLVAKLDKDKKVIHSVINTVFNKPIASAEFNILLVAGGHGMPDQIFPNIKTLQGLDINQLKQNIIDPLISIKFDVIIVEACVTGYVMSAFEPLLKPNGVLIGTLTSSDFSMCEIILRAVSSRVNIDQVLILNAIKEKSTNLSLRIRDEVKHNILSFDKSYAQSKNKELPKNFDITKDIIRFREPIDQFKGKSIYSKEVVMEAFKKVVLNITKYALENEKIINSLSPDVRGYGWQVIGDIIQDIIKNKGATVEWEDLLNDETIAEFIFQESALRKNLNYVPLQNFLEVNSPSILIVYDNKNKKYFYESWIKTNAGTLKLDETSVQIDFNEIKDNYSNEERNKFTAIPDLSEKLSEIWGLSKK